MHTERQAPSSEAFGKDPNSILSNPLKDHSSWHLFQARSWIDFAKRSQIPSALQYAAFELRYGLEYVLFELLVMANEDFTFPQYQKCLGDPKQMKTMLGPYGANYENLARFTKILADLSPGWPPLRFWDINELFRLWGVASSFLHFLGAHKHTFNSHEWFVKSLGQLDSIMEELWANLNSSIGTGILRPSNMYPEVRQAWEEFSSQKLSEEALKIRLTLMQPMLRRRSL